MKRFLLLISIIFLSFISLANAGVVNHFVPMSKDDVNISYYQLWNGLETGWEFGVFDFGGDPSEGIVLTEGGEESGGASFIVENNILKITRGINQWSTLDLGDSPDFSFFMKDSSGNYYTDLNISSAGAGMYWFSYNNAGSVTGYDLKAVTGYDLKAVPIPGSLLLLSSVGLILIAFRKNI